MDCVIGKTSMKKVGIVALQGSFSEHANHIREIGHIPVLVKKPADLNEIHALILPGGESTTLGTLFRTTGLGQAIRGAILSRLPVWGTCAGMILLARKIKGEDTVHLGMMDIEVTRNAYGSQLNSFKSSIQDADITGFPSFAKDSGCKNGFNTIDAIPLVFIRAPYIERCFGRAIPILTLNDEIVAARQDNMLVTSFHPELTEDLRFHKWFINGAII